MKLLYGLAVPLVLCAALALADDQSPPSGDVPAAAPKIAARVNGEPVYVRQVDRHLQRALGGRKADPAAMAALRGEALQQIINRRLILQYLAKTKQGASSEDVDLALARVAKQLAQQDLALDDYLKQSDMTRDDLRLTLAWQIGWRRYLERYLTEENLQKYFDGHRRDFDGTKLRVAHILLKVEPAGSRAAQEAAVQRAAQIREEIVSKQKTFAEAARAYSQAPTAQQGGDIGMIQRRQPMPESFSKAAFQLDENEVSPPTLSPFGVHLIQCLEVHPGKKTWQDAAEELESAVTQYLFDWLAQRERTTAQVEITSTIPYDNQPAAKSPPAGS